jgi:hypothetical protein
VISILTSIFIISSCISGQPVPDLTSQTTPEVIISKAVQAIGGRRALENIKSFTLHGVMLTQDDRPVVEIDLSTSVGGKVLGILTFIGVGQSRFGSDGTTAWEQNLDAKQEPLWTIIEQKALSQKIQQINWLEWFTMLPAKISNIEYIGEEEFDGETCVKLLLKEEDKEEIAFFSISTHRPRGRRKIENTPNGEVIIDVYFRNWQRVEDLLLFHTVVFDQNGSEVSFKMDRISVESIPDSMFTLPEYISTIPEPS